MDVLGNLGEIFKDQKFKKMVNNIASNVLNMNQNKFKQNVLKTFLKLLVDTGKLNGITMESWDGFPQMKEVAMELIEMIDSGNLDDNEIIFEEKLRLFCKLNVKFKINKLEKKLETFEDIAMNIDNILLLFKK